MRAHHYYKHVIVMVRLKYLDCTEKDSLTVAVEMDANKLNLMLIGTFLPS